MPYQPGPGGPLLSDLLDTFEKAVRMVVVFPGEGNAYLEGKAQAIRDELDRRYGPLPPACGGYLLAPKRAGR